jgi:hypothetical protein
MLQSRSIELGINDRCVKGLIFGARVALFWRPAYMPAKGGVTMRLKYITPKQWTEVVLGDLDAFLLDHAACERKASATAMKFVTHYPDRPELVNLDV